MPDGTPKEDLNALLQTLLEDRFSLKVHRGPKTEQGFALVVGKDGPRLKPAVPPPTPAQDLTEEEKKTQNEQKMLADLAAARKRRQEHPESAGAPSNTESWPSITTDELAAQLVRFTDKPVVDETGLTGEYSVSIQTSKGTDGSGVSIFDAVKKLGLKLEPRKVTVETVVVDQVSKTPTAN